MQETLNKILHEVEELKKSFTYTKKEFLTIEEAAEYLGLQVRTLYQFNHKKLIPYYKMGNHTYYKLNELDEYIESSRVSSYRELL